MSGTELIMGMGDIVQHIKELEEKNKKLQAEWEILNNFCPEEAENNGQAVVDWICKFFTTEDKMIELEKENKKLQEKNEELQEEAEIREDWIHNVIRCLGVYDEWEGAGGDETADDLADRVASENKTLKEKNEELQEELGEVWDELEKTKEEDEELKEENKKLEEENEDNLASLNFYTEQCAELKVERKQLKEEINHKNKKFAEWCEENKKLKEEIKKLKKEHIQNIMKTKSIATELYREVKYSLGYGEFDEPDRKVMYDDIKKLKEEIKKLKK